MSKNVRIQIALDNWDDYVAILAAMPDKKLADKLETIYLQSEIAVQKRITESVELLEVWRAQVIEARILKAENNIPDAPNEIELAIADIETMVIKAEERKEIIKDAFANNGTHKTKVKEDNSNQTSLF